MNTLAALLLMGQIWYQPTTPVWSYYYYRVLPRMSRLEKQEYDEELRGSIIGMRKSRLETQWELQDEINARKEKSRIAEKESRDRFKASQKHLPESERGIIHDGTLYKNMDTFKKSQAFKDMVKKRSGGLEKPVDLTEARRRAFAEPEIIYQGRIVKNKKVDQFLKKK